MSDLASKSAACVRLQLALDKSVQLWHFSLFAFDIHVKQKGKMCDDDPALNRTWLVYIRQLEMGFHKSLQSDSP